MTQFKLYGPFLLLFVYSFLILIILNKILNNPKPIKSALNAIIVHFMILIIVNLLKDFTGIYLGLTPINISVSLLAGVPGICTLLIFNMIFLYAV